MEGSSEEGDEDAKRHEQDGAWQRNQARAGIAPRRERACSRSDEARMTREKDEVALPVREGGQHHVPHVIGCHVRRWDSFKRIQQETKQGRKCEPRRENRRE